MRYTTEDGGRLNNFAVEPKMYQASPATSTQKRNYWFIAIATGVLVIGLMAISVSIS